MHVPLCVSWKSHVRRRSIASQNANKEEYLCVCGQKSLHWHVTLIERKSGDDTVLVINSADNRLPENEHAPLHLSAHFLWSLTSWTWTMPFNIICYFLSPDQVLIGRFIFPKCTKSRVGTQSSAAFDFSVVLFNMKLRVCASAHIFLTPTQSAACFGKNLYERESFVRWRELFMSACQMSIVQLRGALCVCVGRSQQRESVN